MGVTGAQPLVAPFRGERYRPGLPLEALIAPPYDVMDEADRAAYARRHAQNIVHLILPRGGADPYARAAELLAEWRRTGILVPDPSPAVYVVRQRFRLAPGGPILARTGLVAAVAAEPFSAGRVKPHERTHAGPKQDRLALLRATATVCEALLFLSRDRDGLLRQGLAAAASAAPDATAELEGVEIALWRVGGATAESLAAAAGSEPLYIADGHHRYETAVAYRSGEPGARWTVGVVVPLGDPGLVILPTHRIVGAAPTGRLPERLARIGEVEPLGSPDRAPEALEQAGPGTVVLVLAETAYRLRRPPWDAPELAGLPAAVRALDVAWVDAVVLPALAGEARAIRYTPRAAEAVEAVRQGAAPAAVLLRPPSVEAVLAVADAGGVMPPKATFFLPKVPSGLVLLDHRQSA